MTTRDERWEKVHAYIGPIEGYLYEEDDEPLDRSKYLEIRIEVVYDGMLYYQIHKMHEAQRAELYDWPGAMKFLLDIMVESIDHSMEGTI